MFQFPGLAREFRDQSSFDNYPGLFAVFHALHSLLVPRHPPCALNSLTTIIQPSLILDQSCDQPALQAGGNDDLYYLIQTKLPESLLVHRS